MRQGTKPFEGTGGHGWQRGATLHPTENRAALAAWVITLWPRAEVRAESAVRRPVFDTVITNNDEFKSILKRAELPWPLCTAWHHPKSPVCSYWGQSTSRSSRCWLFAYQVGGKHLHTNGSGEPPANDDWVEVWSQMPKLPARHQRWTVRRKAAVVEAVRGGWLPIEDVCQLYNISVDEFLAWERDIDRYGLHGLRVTRYQIYRDTERAARIAEHDPQIHGRKACLVKLACDGIALATPDGRRRRAPNRLSSRHKCHSGNR